MEVLLPATVRRDTNGAMIQLARRATRCVPCRVLGILLVLAAAGCGATDPYIYKFDEFNRGAKDFNVPVTDRDSVTICYNGVGTTDAQIARMAETECEQFGKVALRQLETFGNCPMFTPVEARFACLAPGAAQPAETESPAGAQPAKTEPSADAQPGEPGLLGGVRAQPAASPPPSEG
ncbi:MAG: hypothetical protein HWD60_16665 [Defluviicoccus sp.]|nr:MAG: hypothetical protein HWD60_16665 [Defluviicoccus sp.]